MVSGSILEVRKLLFELLFFFYLSINERFNNLNVLNFTSMTVICLSRAQNRFSNDFFQDQLCSLYVALKRAVMSNNKGLYFTHLMYWHFFFFVCYSISIAFLIFIVNGQHNKRGPLLMASIDREICTVGRSQMHVLKVSLTPSEKSLATTKSYDCKFRIIIMSAI